MAALPALAQSPADRPWLHFPADCTLGDNCFIQNYVDRDQGPGWSDFTCGGLSYDGHRGTDITLLDHAAMRAGVDIRPAAPGRVHAIRDELPDIRADDPNAPDLKNRECGNAVIINHGGGRQTWYCHLKRGSVRVRPGDRVTLQTVIGQIGMSGRAITPHLHFTVRDRAGVIDPFQANSAKCGAGGPNLWLDNVTYAATGLISAGFHDALPDVKQVFAGTAHQATLPRNAPAIVLWVHLFGAQQGDTLHHVITRDGQKFFDDQSTVTAPKARLTWSMGRKNRGDWTPGTYRGTVRLIRDGTVLGTMTTEMRID